MSLTRKTEFKLAGELSSEDIGKRIKGYHGARGVVSGKPAPTLNGIKEITLTHSGVYVKVWRNRYETVQTFYATDEEVKLTYLTEVE